MLQGTSRFQIPDQPSLPRKIVLSPATLLYAVATALHRACSRPAPAVRLPLIVIGSLRAGGAGKTPVTLALARHLSTEGFRTGVLAYAMPQPGRMGGGAERSSGLREVFPDSDWRDSSDEAVLLARSLHNCGVRVFVTRHRAKARAELDRLGLFDVLVSDDGLMDARLRDPARRDPEPGQPPAPPRILRVALTRRGERPGLWDLLPAGPWRLTAAALRATDLVLEEGTGYTRTLLPPPSWPAPWPSPSLPVWVLAGLGHPRHFLQALAAAGVVVRGASCGPDHGIPDLARAVREAQRAGVSRFLCSAKDWVKLQDHPQRPSTLHVVDEAIHLDPGFLERIASFLRASTS